MRRRNRHVDEIELETHESVRRSGRDFDRAVFKKALEKAKRWMRAAYGSVDYGEFIAESGPDISAYYDETLETPDGINTFNRETIRRNR